MFFLTRGGKVAVIKFHRKLVFSRGKVLINMKPQQPRRKIDFQVNFSPIKLRKKISQFLMKNLYHNLQDDPTRISLCRFYICLKNYLNI